MNVTVIKDLGLNKSDIKARKDYNASGSRLKTKEYTSDVILKTLGEDYFKKRHISKK